MGASVPCTYSVKNSLMSVSIQILGQAQLEKNLKKFGQKAQKEREATVVAAAELVRQAISDKAPRRSGALADSIIAVEAKGNKPDGPFVMDVGPSRQPAWYAHFIEFGTGPREIGPIDGGGLKLSDNDFASQVGHPGTPARPFIRPGFDENIETATSAAGAQFVKGTGL
jgi:HK97 gp10 family phage protein